MTSAFLNLVLFQASWFAAVIGGAVGWPVTGILPAAVTVAVHLWFHRRKLQVESMVIAAVTLLGLVVETAFIASGAIAYAGSTPGSLVPPVWILALWFAFGTLPSASLKWLEGRWAIQAGLGAIAGPASYYGGEKLGAAALQLPLPVALLIIGVGWAFAMPAIFMISSAISRHLKPAGP